MIKIPNYKILKKIGSGGMGDVYLAEHSLIKRKVAIKSLHSNLVKNTDFIKRFRKEGETLAGLDHPNIVRLNEYIEHDGGLFLIMEFVEGVQLDNYIKNETGPIPEKELVSLFSQVLDAITYAHKKDIIHRDIKPSNIFVTADKKVKILDFGIAKLASENKGITKTGVQVGTVTYMSPEQVKGVSVDKLTDIYSLGVTLFQMAVGKVPYDNTNAFNTQMQIVSEPFPKPTEFYPGVSRKIENIIIKATQKDKKDRYQSCEEFKKGLDSSAVKNWGSKPVEIKEGTTKNKYSFTAKILFPILFFVVIVFGWFYFFQSDDKDTDYDKDISAIRSYVSFVDNRDIVKSMELWAVQPVRYWDLHSPSISEIENKIKKSWKILSYSKNEIIEIVKVDNSTYHLSTNFKFMYRSTGSTKSKASKVIYVLNENHKIISSYAIDSLPSKSETKKVPIIDITIPTAAKTKPKPKKPPKPKQEKNKNKNLNKPTSNISTTNRLNSPSFSVEYYINKANDAYDKGKYQLAITYYSSALRIDPKNHYIYYRRGFTNKILGNFNDAISDYTKAIKIKPKPLYYKSRGIAKQDAGLSFCNDYKKACELGFEAACKWHNDDCKTSRKLKNQAFYLKKGMKFYEDKDYESAIDNYTKAIKISPVFSLAYYQRGLAYFKLKRFQESIDDYTEAIRLFSNEPHNIKNLTLAFRNRAESKERIIGSDFCADFKKACDLGVDEYSCSRYKDCR